MTALHTMTTPTPLVLWLLSALGVVLLASAWEPALLWVGLAGNVIVIGACVVEGSWLARHDVRVRRRWPGRAQIDRPATLVIEVENRARQRLSVALRQHWPPGMEGEREGRPGLAHLVIAPGERAEVSFQVTPRQRGRMVLDPLEVGLSARTAPFAFARRRWIAHDPEGAAVTVFPDLQSVWAYEKLRRSRALRHVGVHQQRMVGAGREFDQLRDYLPDDDYRSINWKATARRMEPITTVHQAERSRDVLLCMDCGRMMGDPLGRATVLDRAVDAALLLAHASTGQGDRVGLLRLTRRVEFALKPAAGSAAMRAVIEGLVQAAPEPVFPSYAALAQHIRYDQSHRSLIFLFTSLNDPQLAGELASYVPLLSRRHLVVVVSLRDPLLDRTADGPAETDEALYQVLAARRLINERDAHRRSLTKHGIHVLEADAQSIQLKLVNTYLSIKSRQLL